MIKTFANKLAEQLFDGNYRKEALKFPAELRTIAGNKLDRLNFAENLETLKVPPSNKLEKLKDDLKGFYSIRINDQWRIVFKFKEGDAYDVKVMDYH